MKSILFKSPEYYLALLVLLAGYSPPFHINPVCVFILAALIFQIIFKNRLTGLTVGVLFFAANLYFLGALFSEFFEFPGFSNSAQTLLLVGLPIWILNTGASLVMIYKYAFYGLKGSPQTGLNDHPG